MNSKVSIIGSGSVGATVAYACMLRGVADELAIYDINAAKTRAEVLDLSHGMAFVPPVRLEGSADVAVTRGSRVIVVTAGAKQRPGQTRLELAGANVAICRQVLPPLLEQSPDAIVLLVTNPVDVITYAALKLTGLPRHRVFGSGTVLDSARFRYLIASHLNVAVQSVHAYIAGEHGDSSVPLWSSATIGATPLSQWSRTQRPRIDEPERAAIFNEVKTAAYQIIEGKGATNYAIGLTTADVLMAIVRNEHRVLPVTTLIEGDDVPAELRDVCLSLPCIVGRDGASRPLPVPLSDAERSGLSASAAVIRSAIRSVGF